MTSWLDRRPVELPSQSAKKTNNAATGASAAGIRAVSAQVIQFYFRAPAKAFFRTRIDDQAQAYARAVDPRVQKDAPWSWRTSTPGILAHAVKTHGWEFLPKHVLPPMLANMSVGAVLYTSYLQTLGILHEPASRSQKRVDPPAPFCTTLKAGLYAGCAQSIVAAPLDALQVRFRASEMLEGRYTSMWHYALEKLRTIGFRGVFSGYSITFLKDSLGSALFFGTFEYTKTQAYYAFLARVYRRQSPSSEQIREQQTGTIRPHYIIEPTFLLLAGIVASISQQAVQYPLAQIQNVHFNRLESLDYSATLQNSRKDLMRLYYHAYQKTLEQCMLQAKRMGGWRQWLYKGFLWNTVRMTPSTSAGLIVFEVVRRKYGISDGEVRIQQDGQDILLS